MKRLAFLAALVPVYVVAQDAPKIDTSFDLTLANKYVWRGINLSNDWVLQPNVTLSSHGFSLGFWGNMELTNWNAPNYVRRPAGKFTEFDTTLAYGQSFGSGDWSVGYTDYQYPGTGIARYGEWFASATFGEVNFTPTVSIYKGDKSNMGTYLELGGTHEFTGAGQSLTLDGFLGYGDKRSNSFYYGNNKNAFTHIQLDLSTSFEVGQGWALQPKVSYSTLLERNHLAGQPRRSNVSLGLTLSRAF